MLCLNCIEKEAKTYVWKYVSARLVRLRVTVKLGVGRDANGTLVAGRILPIVAHFEEQLPTRKAHQC